MNMSGDCITVVHPLFQEEGDGSIPISPLQLIVFEINARLAQRLNELWHSVLPETHLGNIVGATRSVCFGASYANRFYAVAIWTTPIAANRMTNGFSTLELRRLAISNDAPKNTASRLLRVMQTLLVKKWPELTALVSYQAIEHHAGTIYKAAGWSVTGTSKSSVWHKGENRRPFQTDSRKQRWEKQL